MLLVLLSRSDVTQCLVVRVALRQLDGALVRLQGNGRFGQKSVQLHRPATSRNLPSAPAEGGSEVTPEAGDEASGVPEVGGDVYEAVWDGCSS